MERPRRGIPALVRQEPWLPGALLALALLAVVASTDFWLPRTDGGNWWSRHGLMTELVGGVALAVFAALAITRVRTHRASERWLPMAHISFKAIGAASFNWVSGMDQLLTNCAPGYYRSPLTPVLGDVRGALRRKEAALQALPEGDASSRNMGRLRVLLGDPAWVEAAFDGVDILKKEHRSAMAEWVPALLQSDELSRVIVRGAHLNELAWRLQEPLRELAEADDPSYEFRAHVPRPQLIETIVDRWQIVMAEAVSMREDLMRAAGLTQWQDDGGRARLRPDYRQMILDRQQQVRDGVLGIRDAPGRPLVEADTLPRLDS